MTKIRNGVATLLSDLVQALKFMGRVIAIAWWPVAMLWRALRWVMLALFGSLSYEAPQWYTAGKRAIKSAAGFALRTSQAWLRKDRKRAVITLAAALVALLAWVGYASLPKPSEATFTISSPARTRIEDPKAKPDPVTVVFSQAVAPMDRIGKEVLADITLSPPAEGTWAWLNDRRLQFTPRNDWPVGTEYSVSFDRSLTAEQVALQSYRARFATARFEASISEVRFYQDPVDPTAKKVVTTVNFTHPVDTADFEKRVKLSQEGKRGGFLNLGREATKFRVSYDKLRLNAYIHSEPLPIPDKNQRMDIVIDSGVRAAQGGEPTGSAIKRGVTIPGLYSLGVQEVASSQVENDQLEPDRVLVVNFSSDVPEREAASKIQAWVLPVYHPDTPDSERKRPYAWGDTQRIGADILKQSEALKLEPIAAERESAETHSFKYKAEAGRFLYVKVAKSLTSSGGYRLEKDFDRSLQVQAFPKQLKILAAGSLLSVSGEKKLPFIARDVPAVRVELGRLLPQQIQHLVTMSSGSFSNPEFLGNFNESNLTERFTEVVEFPAGVAGRPNYSAVDFGRYLAADGGRRGVFFLKLESYDPKTKRTTGTVDRRLIVVSDLGILVKKSLDGSQDVFVQSIHSGQPVAGAAVDVLARNGQAVVSRVTDGNGRASVPDLKSFERERQPVLYLVRQQGDTSFLPVASGDRLLNFSRFEVGGVSNATDSSKLSAYLFSDRGIYRPGDEIRVGLIVKTADWGRKLAGVPLEAEIVDPRGQVVRREKLKLSSTGLEELKYKTLDSSPAGDYTVQLYIVKDGQSANQIGSLAVKVQEFLPDRMKMTTRLSAEAVEGWVSPNDLRARITLQNLFGTPAANRRVRAALTLSPAFPSFASHRGYQFYDPQRMKEEVNEALAETTTNDKGEAEFDLNLGRFDRATFRAQVLAQGFEAEGGRSVASEAATLVSSMPYLVGWKADGDLGYVARNALRHIELIAVNPKAKRIDVADLKLVHIERKFISVLMRQSNGTYRYESRPKEVPLSEKPLSIAAGGTRLAVASDTPGTFVYVLRGRDGLELSRITYSVAGKANITRSLDRNAELQLTLDKRDYKPGEYIEMQIQAPYVGAGLITIERERVYTHVWFKTSTTSTTQRIRVPADLEGNAYVNVAFIRDPSSDEIYMSPLSYGVQPFSVNLDRRKTQLSVRAPELVKPGETVKIAYKTDRPAKILLFAVDEGILQVARYKTADPLAFFFQKRALEVKTTQILDLILPEYRRLIGATAPGGDAEGAIGRHLNPFKRKRDQPVAYWSGVLESGPELRELSWTVPDYFNGAVRVMAVAVSDDTIGTFEKKMLVRGDIVLSPNVPTTVTPGDEFEVSVGVANNVSGSGANAAVKVGLKTSEHLEVLGDKQVELKIGELRESSTVFRIRVKDALGSATLTFDASLGAKTGRIATDVSVRPASPYQTRLQIGTLNDGKVEVPITRELYSEHRQLEASISYLPLNLTHGLTAYLDNFAYSCTEQLVSQGVPALILSERPEFGYLKSRSGKSLLDLVAVLRSRQNAEGGYGLWASNHHVVDFVAVYAQHFLVEAKERGQPVPADMLAGGNNYLRQLAASEGDSLEDERARAYAIYVLTRQGTVTANLATTLQKRLEEHYEKDWQQDIAAGYLAAAYQLMKQDSLAERLIGGLKLDSPKTHSPYYDVMSRDAQLLYLIARHFPQRMKSVQSELLAALVKPMRQGLYNTFSSAYTILALDAVATLAEKQPAQSLSMAEILRDKKLRPMVLPTGLIPRVAFSAEAARLQMGNESKLAAYYMVNESGFDRKLPEKEIKNGLELVREYVDLTGKPVKTVKLGEEIEVRLRFRAIGRKSVPDAALVDLLPGGFEVVTEPRGEVAVGRITAVPQQESGDEGEGDDGENGNAAPRRAQVAVPVWRSPIATAGSTWQADYADVREDRIVVYGTVLDEAREFIYRIKATNAGTFVVPPAYGESMYEREVQARSLAQRITVERK